MSLGYGYEKIAPKFGLAGNKVYWFLSLWGRYKIKI